MKPITLLRPKVAAAVRPDSKFLKTIQGKIISARQDLHNAWTSKSALLEGEDLAAYRVHHAAYRRHYKPVTNEANFKLVTEIADLNWRLLRVPIFEERIRNAETLAYSTAPPAIIAAALKHSRGLRLVRSHTKHIHRCIDKSHAALQGETQLPQYRPSPRRKHKLAA